MRADDSLPSTFTDEPWIALRRKRDPYTGGFAEGGKYLIFRRRGEIDAAWLKVAEACRQGRLREVKVSTRHTQHVRRFGEDRYVICVYTRESRQDRNAALRVLRSLGFREQLDWKSNAKTLEELIHRSKLNADFTT